MSTLRFLERPDEPRIAYSVDPARGRARGRVLLVHGYAEHSGRYQRVVDLWCELGLAVGRFDLRGHGRSDGPRGHADSFDDFVRDTKAVLDVLSNDEAFQGPARPILFGHSFGGLVGSHTALELGGRVAGLALTSPFFGLARRLALWERALTPVAGRLLPTLRQPSGLAGSDMTHDQAIASAYDADPLGFKHTTVGWFFQVTRAQRALMEAAPRLRLPLFCIAAGDDRAVSVEAVERFFALAGSPEKELDVRPGLFHEVLNEPDYRTHATRLGERMLRWSVA